MPEIHEKTPRGEYTVAGETFSIPRPYHVEHRLTEGEASQLNQVFAENIRNNLAAKVKAAVEAGSFEQTSFQTSVVDEYVKTYEMGVRTGGGGRTSDPVAAAALEIARGLVKGAITKQGIRLADVTSAQITAKAKEVIAANPQITELARKQVESTKALAGLVLGEVEAPTEVTPPKGKKG